MRAIGRHILSGAVWTTHWLLSHLPHRASVELAALVGRSYARLGAPRVSDARINLEIAFPEKTPEERERILLESFANSGRCLAELCLLTGSQARKVVAGVGFDGMEILDAASALSPTGALMGASAHIGSWELCGAALVKAGVPLSVVHQELENPQLERIVTGGRHRSGLETVKLGEAALGVFKAIRRGRYLGLLVDQNARVDEGVFAPFFGLEACTRSGPVQIAMRSGVPILPLFMFREGTSLRHTVKVYPPIPMESGEEDPEGALVRNVTKMNAAIERAIREVPEQWLWSHRRWKTRPPEDPTPIYPRRNSWLHRLRRRLR